METTMAAIIVATPERDHRPDKDVRLRIDEKQRCASTSDGA